VNKEIWYTARRTFDADNQEDFGWQQYIEWSRLYQVKELVSLDGILNHLLFEPNFNAEDEFKHIVIEDENTVTAFFNSLEYVIEKAKETDYFNLLAVVKEPNETKAVQLENDFDFMGYDLIETTGDISALTNCGGFDETFLPEALNEYGLISNFNSAVDIQKNLKINNPMEAHADCDLFEVWRHKSIGVKELKPFDNDFYVDLEYHLCVTFKKSNITSISCLWCDGIEPQDNVIMGLLQNKQITTRAWIGKDGQKEYRMTINFGDMAIDKYFKKESIADCFPNSDTMDWIQFDAHKALITVNLL
jgi:hypothetical protein